MKRTALYVRVSTDRQTVENQIAALGKVAEALGWQIVATFRDEGISGAKVRNARPGLDEMLKQAQRGRFDVVMAWAIDRLGRSLVDLLHTIESLKDRSTVDRHNNASRQAHASNVRGIRRVRAEYAPSSHPSGVAQSGR
jgi:DNA invertase Pin-like site-specific DNA recombinase